MCSLVTISAAVDTISCFILERRLLENLSTGRKAVLITSSVFVEEVSHNICSFLPSKNSFSVIDLPLDAAEKCLFMLCSSSVSYSVPAKELSPAFQYGTRLSSSISDCFIIADGISFTPKTFLFVLIVHDVYYLLTLLLRLFIYCHS